jgi:hypothetical protein
MTRDKRLLYKDEKQTGLSEKQFVHYLDERFRRLRLDEQKFREEVLTKRSILNKNSQYIKNKIDPQSTGALFKDTIV